MKHLNSILTSLILAISLAGIASTAMAQKEPIKICAQCGKGYKQSQFPRGSICSSCVAKNKRIAEEKAKRADLKLCSKCHKRKNKSAFSKNAFFCKDCQNKIVTKPVGGNVVSLREQALNYYNGTGGVSKNIEKAIELFVKSAANGDDYSLDCLQYICKNDNKSGKYDRKLQSCKDLFVVSKKVYEGDESAINNYDDLYRQYWWALSMCYVYGIGTQRDRAKAEEVFELVEGSDPYYRCNAARVYEEGDFGVVDYKKALEFYEFFYDVYAPAKAATFYIEGKGTTKNIPKALELLQYSIEIGEEWDAPANFAKYVLGKLYFEGEDVERDYDKAFKLFKEASESPADPDCDAMYMLSICYRFGFGTEKNLEKAKYWQVLAQEHGSEDA